MNVDVHHHGTMKGGFKETGLSVVVDGSFDNICTFGFMNRVSCRHYDRTVGDIGLVTVTMLLVSSL